MPDQGEIILDMSGQGLYIDSTLDPVLVVIPRACGKGRLGFFWEEHGKAKQKQVLEAPKRV
jgi:hypothetical protein